MSGIWDKSQSLEATTVQPFEVTSEECFADLLEVLHKDIPNSLPIIGMVQNALRWRRKGANDLNANQKVYTFRGSSKPGTCVGILEATLPVRGVQGVTFYIQDGENQKVKSTILEAALHNSSFHETWCWAAEISESSVPIFKEFAAKQNITHSPNLYPVFHFWIEKKAAINLEVKCPPDVKLGPLTEDQSEYLDSLWPLKREGSHEYTRILLAQNFGIGVYIEESEMPVAWVLLSQNSCMTQLFTLEAHRGKGYAKLVCAAMGKKLAEMDIYPRADVGHDNHASKALFTKLGYKTDGTLYYVGLKQR